MANLRLHLSKTGSQNSFLLEDPPNGNPKYSEGLPLFTHPNKLAICVHSVSENEMANK